MKNNINGVGVALVTPFSENGEVDYDALGALIDYVSSNGVDYLVALGTTAETPTLSDEEKIQVQKYIIDRNAGKLPVVLGVGGYDTACLINKIAKTDLTGVEAILSVTPYYNKPTQEGLFQHYKAIAANSPVPIMLYNVPGRTGVNLTAETTLRIAHQVENIMGIKEACGNMTQIAKIITGRPEGFKVISGDDCLAVPIVALGGDGIISVAANAFPKAFTQMMEAAYVGDRMKVASYYHRLFDVMEALFAEGNPAGVKAALAAKGIVRNSVRLPLVPASESLAGRISDLIAQHSI